MITRTGRRAFLCGAIFGAATSWVLLVSGVGQVWMPPLWQYLAFYPGLVSGWAFYDCCNHWFSATTALRVSETVGILAVAVTYGLVAFAGHMTWSRVRKRRSAAQEFAKAPYDQALR